MSTSIERHTTEIITIQVVRRWPWNLLTSRRFWLEYFARAAFAVLLAFGAYRFYGIVGFFYAFMGTLAGMFFEMGMGKLQDWLDGRN